MKKYNLLKILGIFFLVSVILTWFIPIGTYVDNVVQIDSIKPLGLFDIFYVPLYTILAYSEYAFVLLMIGALYGVFNKIGVYDLLVEKTANRFKNEKSFLVLSILTFSILSSFTGLAFPLFVLVPFTVSVITKMGYSKLTALASTVGAILVGMIGTTFGLIQTVYSGELYSINLFERMGSGIYDKLVMRLITYAVITFLYIMTVLSKSKKDVKEVKTKKEEIKEKGKKKVKEEEKSVLPMFISIVLLTLVSLFTMYHWDYVFGGTLFTNFDSTLVETTIGENVTLYNILGNTLSQIGTFGNLHLIALIFLIILFVSFVYGISLDDTIEGMKDGMKSTLKVAFYVTLANIVMMVINNVSTGSIIVTITNFIAGIFDGFNVITTSLFSLAGGLFYNNLYDFVLDSAVVTHLIAINPLQFSTFALSMQTTFNIMMMILPTSMILVAGLSYLDIKYKEWIKYIWKFIVQVFIITLIITQMTYMLY